MKTNIVVIILITSIFIGSCKKNSTEPTNNHSVSGIIVSNGLPVSNASVSLNKRIDLSVETDTTGHFKITNVPSGDYSLSVQKTNSDGSFLAKTSNISVTNDVIIQTLILPKGVKLDSLANLKATSIKISWNPTDANDFREYKLYRHISSGLDENTGTLVHVSTAINDTQFVDNTVNPFTTYYYRVYVMNDFGKLGGSNIVSGKTLNENFIVNGSFEENGNNSNLPKNWSVLWGPEKFGIDSVISKEGSKSLRADLLVNDWGEWFLYTIVNPSKLEAGKRYQLSFWYKTDTLEQYNSMRCHFATDIQNMGNTSLFTLSDFNNALNVPQKAINWTQYVYEFNAPSTVPSNYYLVFVFDRVGTSNYKFNLPMRAWFDDMRIEKVQ